MSSDRGELEQPPPRGLTRKEFLRRLAALGAGAWAAGKLGSLSGLELVTDAIAAPKPTVAVASGASAESLVRAAIAALGGIGRFVKRGNRVVIKSNAAWARKPETAANTNPAVVAELVRLCRGAGAREVAVVEHPCDTPERLVFQLSGIERAARGAGAQMIGGGRASLYQTVHLPKGRVLRSAGVMRKVLQADAFINVPVAKVHSATGVTIGMKNLMGVTWDRQAWHSSADLHQCIADYATVVRPTLVLVDGTRVLLTNGPKGPGKVAQPNKVVASTDPVAADAYAVSLLGQQAEQIGFIRAAYQHGLGEMDPARMTIKRV